jgi:hypothetical protein
MALRYAGLWASVYSRVPDAWLVVKMISSVKPALV